MKIYCFDKKKNHDVVAGDIQGDTFIKKVNSSKHLIKKYNGYGIQTSVIPELLIRGVKTLVFELSTRSILSISIEDFSKKCIKDDLGSGMQSIIPARLLTNIKQEQFL